jgi:phosphatidylglycerol:prolipoprotein diacylglycerol transferase
MHRILFQIGDYPIYSFGVFVALGVLVGAFITARLAWRAGLSREQALDAVVWIVALGILLARLAYVAQDLKFFAAHPHELLNFRGGGMSWHGGILGMILGTALIAKRTGARFADLLDVFAPAMMAGLAVGRIGCFLNGCCYGRVSDVPWACPLPHEATGVLLYRHPAPLYEMAAAFAMFGILLVWLRHRRFHGEVFLGFLLLYSSVRFGVEFFREGKLLAGGLSLAQYVSLGLMALGTSIILFKRANAAETGHD